MNIPAITRLFGIALLAIGLIAISGAPAYAGMIGTQELLAEQSLQDDRDKINAFLDRADVQDRLQDLDVPALPARERVDALTAAEAASLAQRIDTLPAAGALSETDFIIILLVAILVALIV